MDPIAKFEVILNALNTAIAYAFYYKAPQLSKLQKIQRELYRTNLSKLDLDKKLEDILLLRKEVMQINYASRI
jgi:hypothetical protein